MALHQQFGNTSMCSKLDEYARHKLIGRAALFGIHAQMHHDRMHLRLDDQDVTLDLPMETGLCRLVAELAEILTPWVIFSAGKPPEKVLLQYTDVKYRKLVAAYNAAKKAGQA